MPERTHAHQHSPTARSSAVPDPRTVATRSPAATVLEWQRRYGNQVVAGLLAGAQATGRVQAKRQPFAGESSQSYGKSLAAYGASVQGTAHKQLGAVSPAVAAPEGQGREDTTTRFEERYATEQPSEVKKDVWLVRTALKSSPKTYIYVNEFDLDANAITAPHNWREQDQTPDEAASLVEALRKAGKTPAEIRELKLNGLGAGKGALENSEIFRNQHGLALAQAQRQRVEPGDIGMITRANVVNETTRRVVSLLHDGRDEHDRPSDAWRVPQRWTWEDGEDFRALLYTPNVRPAAFLLLDHPSLGREISSIKTTPVGPAEEKIGLFDKLFIEIVMPLSPPSRGRGVPPPPRGEYKASVAPTVPVQGVETKTPVAADATEQKTQGSRELAGSPGAESGMENPLLGTRAGRRTGDLRKKLLDLLSQKDAGAGPAS